VPPVALAALLYVGVFSGAIAYLAYFALVDEAGATRANLLFYFVPVVSAVGGWALLGETLPVASLVGFGVIFAGFVLVSGPPVTLPGSLRRSLRKRLAPDRP